ncbi:MAG TPA: preprotein translocase subunit SecE [Caulobacteraceae bacterium]|jgi:preprotein translocase subunit SecE|nr:preprotein translocase subunit SecE [Caulobacteraceae bacterium]HEX4097931.1 preprotein translocase subunit SecE [Caulobacteraceae bacterium]
MAKNPGAIPTTLRPRGASRTPVATDGPPKGRFNITKFFNEVRAEARKVTWTSWKETWITSVMVGIMVVLASVFFFGIDGIFTFAMEWVMKLGNMGS